MKAYLGIDEGNYATKIVMVDSNGNIIYKNCVKSSRPVRDIKKLFLKIKNESFLIFNPILKDS